MKYLILFILLFAGPALNITAQSASEGERQIEIIDSFWVAQLAGVNDPPNSRHGDPITACHASFDSFTTIHAGKTANEFNPSIGSEGVMGSMGCDYEGPVPGPTTGGLAQLGCPQGYLKHDGGSSCVRFKPNEGDQCVGNPINVLSGNKIQVEQDFSVGRGRLHFTRYYMSDAGIGFAGPMAVNWTSNFHSTAQSAYNTSRGFFTYRTENGSTIRFLKSRTSGWQQAGLNPYENDDPVFFATRRADQQGYRLEEAEGEDDYTLYLTTPDNVVRTYAFFPQSRGRDAKLRRLETIAYPDGYTITLTYDDNDILQSASDTDGYTISFAYDDRNLLERVIAPDGTEYRYAYDRLWMHVATVNTPNSNHSQYTHILSEVSYPDETPGDATDNPTRRYHYARVTNISPTPASRTSNYLTGITDERGIRISTWAYAHTEAGYRAVASSGANGREETQIDEITPLDQYKVTNALGKEAIYTYRKEDNIYRLTALDGQASANCQASNTTTIYTDQGFPETVTHEEGQVQTTTYFAETDLPETITYGVGTPEETQMSFIWDTTLRKPTQIVQEGVTAELSYDLQHNLDTLRLTDTTAHTVPYTTAGAERLITYEWAEGGLLMAVDGPLAGPEDTTHFAYTTEGNLRSITDAVGNVTTLNAYDAMGRPTRMTDPTGMQTLFAYTPRGWLSAVDINPGPDVRRYDLTYDAAGNLTQLTLPSGGYYSYSYDASGWLTQASSSAGETLTYSYDAMGNVTGVGISVQGRRQYLAHWATSYDELGRILAITGGAGDAQGFNWDRSGRLAAIENGLGMAWHQAFDALDRVVAVTDPDGDVTQTAYDGQGDIDAFSDGRDLTTHYVRNGFGEVIRETSPDRGITDYWYDSAGRMTRRVDAAGREAAFSYDAAGRLAGITYPHATAYNRSFTYDQGQTQIGRLSTAQTGLGFNALREALTYTEFGELSRSTLSLEGRVYTTEYNYAKDGALSQLTYPSGLRLRMDTDAFQRPTALSLVTPKGRISTAILTDIAYHPFGPVAQFTYGSGLQARYGLDTSYRLQSITLGGSKTPLFERRYSYDAAGQIIAQTDPTQPDLSASYTYRPDGRLQQAIGPWGQRGYSYDSVGNRRFSKHPETGDQLQYNTAEDSNRLETILNWTTGGIDRKLTYDAAGSVIQDTREDGTEFSYFYAETGRLERVYAQGWKDKTQREVATYTHDYRGLRIRRVGAGGSVRHFIFLSDGRLLGEYDGSTGQAVIEYIWLGDRLVAQMDAGGKISHVLTGHLGQPLRIMAEDGALLWAGEMDPFGRYYDTVHGAPHTASPLHLRLPGQWAEPGTGLYQNWHRDYDPSLGRYLQVDPIGLAGGQSLYGYAYQNPMSYVDPEGLQVRPPPRRPGLGHNGGPPMRSTATYAQRGRPLNDWLKNHAPDLPRGLPVLGGGYDNSFSLDHIQHMQRLADQVYANATQGGALCATFAPPPGYAPPPLFVDSAGNVFPVPAGGSMVGSPDGRFLQVRGPDGRATGVRKDGGHPQGPKHSDPRSLNPHGHVPGVSNPDGTPWLPVNR